MEFTALVTLLLISQYLVFAMLVGRERLRHGIMAPACSGHPQFDRAYRVHLNTMEQLLVVLPAMWVVAVFFVYPVVGPLLGLLFFFGRILFRNAYMRDPAQRRAGMALGLIAQLGLLACGFWSVLLRL